MFSLINNRPVERWSEVLLTIPGHAPLVYHVPDELGEVLGFRERHGRIVLSTTSGIPMIVRTAEGMEQAILHVRKVAS
jgi:hypothetical protein